MFYPVSLSVTSLCLFLLLKPVPLSVTLSWASFCYLTLNLFLLLYPVHLPVLITVFRSLLLSSHRAHSVTLLYATLCSGTLSISSLLLYHTPFWVFFFFSVCTPCPSYSHSGLSPQQCLNLCSPTTLQATALPASVPTLSFPPLTLATASPEPIPYLYNHHHYILVTASPVSIPCLFSLNSRCTAVQNWSFALFFFYKTSHHVAECLRPARHCILFVCSLMRPATAHPCWMLEERVCVKCCLRLPHLLLVERLYDFFFSDVGKSVRLFTFVQYKSRSKSCVTRNALRMF